MLTIINPKHVMSDNCICFFEISDGVFQDMQKLSRLVRVKYPRKLVLMHSLLLDRLLQQAEVFQTFPSLEIPWKNDDCCSEVYNGRCSIFHMDKNILNANICYCFGLFKAPHRDFYFCSVGLTTTGLASCHNKAESQKSIQNGVSDL